MIDQDEQRFGEGLVALGIAFRTEITDDLIAAFRAGLDDVLIDHLVWAMRESLRRCEYFPSVAVLRSLADRGARAAGEEADFFEGRCLAPAEADRHSFEDGPRDLVHCRICEDLGFEYHECCRGTPCGNQLCEQQGHLPHRYVTLCSCRATNPIFLRNMRPRPKYRKEV